MLPIGNAARLGQELFPDGFVPDVLRIVHESWESFRLPAGVTGEVPITNLFRQALEDSYVNEGKDWFVTLEEPNCDPLTGVQVSRTDLRFLPPGIKRNQRAFILECKRLNIPAKNSVTTNVTAYTGDEGMLRFVTGTYAAQHTCGGMVGYVMDGNLSRAHAALKVGIKKERVKLRLIGSTGFDSCRLTPKHSHDGETRHNRINGEFTIFHILLQRR